MGCSFIAGIQKAAGKVLRPVARIASVIPGPWQVPAAAALAIDSAVNGDIKGALLNGLGAYAAGGGFSANGFQSSTIPSAFGGTGSNALSAYTPSFLGGTGQVSMSGFKGQGFGGGTTPTNPNSFAFSDGASLGTPTPNFDINGQGLLADVAPQLPPNKSLTDQAWDWAKQNPTSAMRLASGVAGGIAGYAGTPSGNLGNVKDNVGNGGYAFNPQQYQFNPQNPYQQYTGGLLFGPK